MCASPASCYNNKYTLDTDITVIVGTPTLTPFLLSTNFYKLVEDGCMGDCMDGYLLNTFDFTTFSRGSK